MDGRQRQARGWGRLVVALLVVGPCMAAGAAAHAQGPVGSIAGRVTDARTALPTAGALVVVAGTTLSGLVGNDGMYVIPNVPAGSRTVSVSLIGFMVAMNSDRTGTGTNVEVWQSTKYPAVITPVPVARYAEAQLIIAEARASTGDLAGAAAAINAARNSGRTDMPQYDATGQTATQVRDQVIEERRRELFLEGRRFWDVRRFDLPLVPEPGTPYLTAGTYGDQRCFPVPAVERNNNPNFS